MKEEALKLADELLRDNTQLTVESAYMIRRLVEELEKQSSSIWDSFRRVHESCQCDSCRRKTAPQTKPLSDEEIDDYTKAYFNIHPEAKLSEQFKIKLYELQDFARAIEERHGIK